MDKLPCEDCVMKTDREILVERYWAIPAICGLFDLHRDFKDGRFAKVTRLVWAPSSVDVYLLYGTSSISRAGNDAIQTIFTIYKNGTVGLRLAAGVSEEGRQQLLRFLAGEASREALRWNGDLVEWSKGTLDDDIKCDVFSLVSAMVAHPLMATDVHVEKSVSVTHPVRRIRLTTESFCTDITPVGMFGVNVYQARHSDGVRNRYMQADMRLAPSTENGAHLQLIKKICNAVLHMILLPIGTVIYVCERKQQADRMAAREFVEYLPNFPATDRADAGMSALSN